MKKQGAEKFLSIYWFFIIFLVAGAVIFMAALFYGSPYNIRAIESDILTERIADCMTERGYLNEQVLAPDFKDNFLEKCHLTFDTEDFSDWASNGQYYTEIRTSRFDSNAPQNSGQKLMDLSIGNVNLKTNYLIENPERKRIGREIDAIVIHYTAGSTLEGALSEFENTHKGIHYLIDKNGDIVKGDTDDGESAIHTNSPAINARSIGIEIVNLGSACGSTEGYCKWNGGTCKQICADAGNGVEVDGETWEKFTPEQIESIIQLLSELVSKYDIPVDREHILGHYQIDTKTRVDPGPLFPWEEVMNRIEKKEVEFSDLGAGKRFYSVDTSNNQYVTEILTFVGKIDKNN